MKTNIQSLRNALKEIESVVVANFQLSQLDVLLCVMSQDPEAIPYKEVEKLTGLPQTSVARNLRILGSRRVASEDPSKPYDLSGYGLIESTIDPWDTRRYAAKLSESGRALSKRVSSKLGGGGKSDGAITR